MTRDPRLPSWILVLLVLQGCLDDRPQQASSERAPVVYGVDDRLDYHEHPSELWKQTTRESVVAQIRVGRLDVSDPEHVLLRHDETLGEDEGLCEGERFFDQPVVSSCSGTLIDTDLVLIAGHCIDSATECSSRSLVFDYYFEAPGALAPIESGDVFACRQVVSVVGGGSLDHGVIQLDRPAGPPRRPARIRLDDLPLARHTPLVVIGFPDGIAAKIDDGGEVLDPRDEHLDYFQASLDTFGGNSGSGVFLDTGELVGILVRGERDYVPHGGCNVVNVVGEDGGSRGGEDVTYVARALAGLCASGWASDLCGDTEGWCRACWGDDVCPEGWTCRALESDPGVTWCASPCADDDGCRPGHHCDRAAGSCTPDVDLRCMNGDLWSFNSCGRRTGLAESCRPLAICTDGECVAAAPGNVCETAVDREPVDQLLRGEVGALHSGEYRGSCGGDGPDQVFRLVVDRRVEVIVQAWGYDTVLFARSDCEDPESEVACNDDSTPPGDRGSRLDLSLEPGEHFLFLDGFSDLVGEYELHLDFDPFDAPDGGLDGDVDGDADVMDSDIDVEDGGAGDADMEVDGDPDPDEADADQDQGPDVDVMPDTGPDGDADADGDQDSDGSGEADIDQTEWRRARTEGCGCAAPGGTPAWRSLGRILGLIPR